MEYSSLSYVAFNPFGNFNNYALGRINNNIEALGQRFFAGSSYYRAEFEFNKRALPDLVVRLGAVTKKPFNKYDNYDAIEVSLVKNIPVDYRGMMGVPISFLDKYSPEQFEIIGLGISNSGLEIGVKPYTPAHKKYRKEVQGRGAVDGDLYLMIDGELKVPYARVLIRNKKVEAK